MSRNNDEVAYKYNGDGLMTERSQTTGGVTTTTRYYYDGANITAEATVSGPTVTFKARYVSGAQLLYREDAAGKAYYLHNGHGDVTSLRQANGTLKNEYSYDIWGTQIINNELIDNPFGYSGEYWDETTSLQYLRARWYDPGLGRFISEDTWEGRSKQPQSLNAYTYVLNNPLIYNDPSGNVVETIVDAASIGWSAYDLWKKPSWGNFGYLAWDLSATILPFVPGSYTAKGTKAVSKAVDKLKDAKGTGDTAPKKHSNRNIKDVDAMDDINSFLGSGKQTDINPFTGKKDPDRIFVKQKDGSVRAVRIGDHETRTPNNQHYHLEQWDSQGNFIRPDQSVKINNSKKR